MSQVTAQPVARQTIPYGDRPFVDINSGRLTVEAYQFLQRLSVGFANTGSNVTAIITQGNANDTQIASLLASIGTLESSVTTVTTRVENSQPSPPYPPPLPPQQQASGSAPESPPFAVLPASRGGTGHAESPQDGQLLIGDTAAESWDIGTITGVSPIVVTNAAGSITVSYSGSTSVYAPVVTGFLPGPDGIATADGQFIMAPIS